MVLLVSLLISVATAIGFTSSDYENYLRAYNKVYESKDEYNIRFGNFVENMKKIQEHNSNADRTWEMGITQFSDWTWEEFQDNILKSPSLCPAQAGEPLDDDELLKDYPTTFDWRSQGVVSKVKDQGKCGSCWSFSTTGAMESHWSIFTRQPPPLLSEQQLVDCSGHFDNFGCDGGLPSQSFEYIKYAGGITTESQYPYTGKDGNCTMTGKTFEAFAPFGSVNVTTNDEAAMMRALYNIGPLSIQFDVAKDFMHYHSGVYDSKECSDTLQAGNHDVLIVGYGVDNGSDYWLVKNSWGTTWGLDGYFTIARGKNMCGIADCPSYPLVGPVNA